ncbi:MAG TPA: ABC transporter ATP-binding protein [Herbaspirillum sp.]|jgi:NitT/TauT family transport system ATP-binding protein
MQNQTTAQTPAPSNALLQVRDLKKTFKRDGVPHHVIDGLSIDIEEGEFVCIVGPSGCGKSTFLHMVGGFESVSGGKMLLRGKPISGTAPDRGMMFQDFSLYPWLTVLENVCWPLEMKGEKIKSRRIEHARKILDTVNLGRFANYYPGQLSGGMKQRVALARLLALDSDMFLMDEPFGALDAQTRELLQEELQQVWLQLPSAEKNSAGKPIRKTVLFVTHDIDEAIFLSSRLIVFSAHPGQIKADLRIPTTDRGIEFRKSSEYHQIRNHVWDLLREEVLKVKAEEGV